MPTLRQLIGEVYSDIQKAIGDVDNKKDIYNAFFKDVPPGDVKSILAKAAVGNFILRGKNRYNPEIACASPSQPRMWKACQAASISGGYILNTHYVYLCPRFFQEETPYPIQSDCGKVVPDKTSMWGSSILDHQLTTLVNVISRLYIAQPFLKPEQTSTNGCMALPPTQSRINPTNYALFVGSECYVSNFTHRLINHTDVKAGCTEFPTEMQRKSSQAADRELLEVDGSQDAGISDLNSTCADPTETNLDSAACPLSEVPN